MTIIATLTGTVISGSKRGSQLGFPTANLDSSAIDQEQVDLADGVYFALTTWQGSRYPSVCYLGAAPTFGSNKRRFESHILDFNQNLYGQVITVELLKYWHEDRAYASPAELIKQIKIDIAAGRSYLEEISNLY